MKWYTVLFISAVIILSILAVYKGLTPQTYSEDGVSFNYPGTWTKLSSNTTNSNTSTLIAAVGDVNNAQNSSYITTAMVQKAHISGTLDQIAAASKTDLENDKKAVMTSDENITINGMKGQDITYNVTTDGVNKENRLIILQKDNTIYSITLSTPASNFNNQKENFNTIIQSFKVTSTSTPQTYNENGVSFNYPDTWNKLPANELGTANGSESTIAVVGDSSNAQNSSYVTTVMVQKSDKSGTLDQIAAASKTDLENDKKAVMTSDENITINGMKGQDITYNVTTDGVNKENRLIILQKDNTIYSITLSTPASNFNNQKENFNTIIQSFKVT